MRRCIQQLVISNLGAQDWSVGALIPTPSAEKRFQLDPCIEGASCN